MALEGSLSDFGLADILQLIYFQRKTGVLALEGKTDGVRLYFIDGNISGAESRNRTENNRIGRILLKKGLISDDVLRSVLEEQNRSGAKIGGIFVSRGSVAADLMKEIINNQITETVVQLFRWKEGTYEFAARDITPDKALPLSLDTQHLLMEGLRILDEWSVIKDRISLDVIFRKKTETPEDLSAEEEEVFSYIDGEIDVSSILELSSRENFEVLKNLLALTEKDLIEPVAVMPVQPKTEMPKTRSVFHIAGFLVPASVLISCLLAVTVPFSISKSKPDLLRDYRASKKIDELRFLIEAYRIEHDALPKSLDAITHEKDPWSREYVYNTDGDSFSISSTGPDGERNTPDDIY